MKLRLLAALLWAGAAAPLAAQGGAPIEGVYQSATHEVGSTLILAPDGRFVWVFAYGSLDLMGEGRWTRAADGTVTLDSDPAVTPPRFELVSRGRDDAPGVAVRLTCDTGEVRSLLNALFVHANGERVAGRIRDFEVRSDEPSPVTAVHLFSESLNLLSEPFPVDQDEANILTFRFVPNDLGRADFRAAPVTIADGILILEAAGIPVRYRREGSAAGEELPRLPPIERAPAETADGAPFALELGLFEDAAAVRSRAGGGLVASELMMVAAAPVDLILSHDGRRIDFGRVEGGARPLIIQEDLTADGTAVIAGFSFVDSARTLEDALARAQALKAWLEQAGFADRPDRYSFIPPPFTLVGDAEPLASDWAGAARALADEERGVTELDLYTLRTDDRGARVRIENSRRIETQRCPHRDWPAGGLDWRVTVELGRSLAPSRE